MITKKIALFGTNDSLVGHVAEEALKRGHGVTVVMPNPNELKLKYNNFKVFSGDLMKHSEVSKYAKDHDVVICLHEPELEHPIRHIKANRALIEGARNANIRHIISLGHPVSLNVVKTKAFYDSWKTLEEVQKETLKLFKNQSWRRWVYLHSVDLNDAQKANKYPTGNEIFLSNPEGTNKIINIHQLTDALLDEAEKTEYILEEDEITI